jgi:DNA-binding MarR family transcriptional regulator
MGYLTLMMHWSSPSPNAAQGITMSRMKAASTTLNYCSPNQVESMVAAMRLFGYVRLENDPYDHRLKVIVPTEKLVNTYMERWRRHFQAMRLIMPEGEIGLAALERPDFSPAFLREISRNYAAGLRVADASHELDTFLDRNCGMMVLLFLVATGKPDGAMGLRAAVSISGLARRFGVSRPHVRKLLTDAETEGLIRDASGDKPVTLLPRVLDGVEKFYASTFLTFAGAIRGATRNAAVMVT